MPLFEYNCTTCNHTFEWLSRTTDDKPECPSCRSSSLERRHSTFAARAASPSSAKERRQGVPDSAAQLPMGPCGTCGDPRGPGACSIN